MIAAATVVAIRAMIRSGEYSQRMIARRLGVSRGTVQRIAHGKRAEPRPAEDEDDDLLPFAGPPCRCAGCGGMVYMPCLLCRLREMKDKGQLGR